MRTKYSTFPLCRSALISAPLSLCSVCCSKFEWHARSSFSYLSMKTRLLRRRNPSRASNDWVASSAMDVPRSPFISIDDTRVTSSFGCRCRCWSRWRFNRMQHSTDSTNIHLTPWTSDDVDLDELEWLAMVGSRETIGVSSADSAVSLNESITDTCGGPRREHNIFVQRNTWVLSSIEEYRRFAFALESLAAILDQVKMRHEREDWTSLWLASCVSPSRDATINGEHLSLPTSQDTKAINIWVNDSKETHQSWSLHSGNPNRWNGMMIDVSRWTHRIIFSCLFDDLLQLLIVCHTNGHFARCFLSALPPCVLLHIKHMQFTHGSSSLKKQTWFWFHNRAVNIRRRRSLLLLRMAIDLSIQDSFLITTNECSLPLTICHSCHRWIVRPGEWKKRPSLPLDGFVVDVFYQYSKSMSGWTGW